MPPSRFQRTTPGKANGAFCAGSDRWTVTSAEKGRGRVGLDEHPSERDVFRATREALGRALRDELDGDVEDSAAVTTKLEHGSPSRRVTRSIASGFSGRGQPFPTGRITRSRTPRRRARRGRDPVRAGAPAATGRARRRARADPRRGARSPARRRRPRSRRAARAASRCLGRAGSWSGHSRVPCARSGAGRGATSARRAARRRRCARHALPSGDERALAPAGRPARGVPRRAPPLRGHGRRDRRARPRSRAGSFARWERRAGARATPSFRASRRSARCSSRCGTPSSGSRGGPRSLRRSTSSGRSTPLLLVAARTPRRRCAGRSSRRGAGRTTRTRAEGGPRGRAQRATEAVADSSASGASRRSIRPIRRPTRSGIASYRRADYRGAHPRLQAWLERAPRGPAGAPGALVPARRRRQRAGSDPDARAARRRRPRARAAAARVPRPARRVGRSRRRRRSAPSSGSSRPADPYDIVLLDVMLPGIDGFEVCRRIRPEARRADRDADRPRRRRRSRGRARDRRGRLPAEAVQSARAPRPHARGPAARAPGRRRRRPRRPSPRAPSTSAISSVDAAAPQGDARGPRAAADLVRVPRPRRPRAPGRASR